MSLTIGYNKMLLNLYRSSRSQVFFKTGVLKTFAIFTGKHLCEYCESFKNGFFYRTCPVAAPACICFVFTSLHSVYVICLTFLVDQFPKVTHAQSADFIETPFSAKARRNYLRCLSKWSY